MLKLLNILSFIPLILLVLLIVIISTGVFIGIGYVISLFLPLTLFQSSLLCMGSTFVVAFIIFGIIIHDSLSGNHNHFEEYEYEDDDEFEEEYDEDDIEMVERIMKNSVKKKLSIDPNFGKVSRNAPCPCGSGKKYKLCCGKVS